MFADAPTQAMVPQAMGHMPAAPPGLFNPATGLPHATQPGGGGVPPWMMGQRMPTRAPPPMMAQGGAPGAPGMMRPPPPPMYGAPRAPTHNPLPGLNSKLAY